MVAMAERLGVDHHVFSNMAPTIYGGPESLPPSQSSTCANASRSPAATPATPSSTSTRTGEPASAKSAATRRSRSWTKASTGWPASAASPTGCCCAQGACTGCTLSGTCGTCMPLVTLYRKAKAPLATYCQHRERR